MANENKLEHATAVAKVFVEMYQDEYDQPMEGLRLQKMMYFAQRESLIRFDAPLFDAKFYGWRMGPVLPYVRKKYKEDPSFSQVNGTVSDESRKLIQEIYMRYKDENPMTLNSRSQEEFSWLYSRKGLSPKKEGKGVIDLDSIRIDAIHEKMRRTFGE